MKKILNNEFILKTYFISNNFKIFNNYKCNLSLNKYYNYIIANKNLFNVNSNFDYLMFFKSIDKGAYISNGDLLNKILINNMQYYKCRLDNVNILYQSI